MDNNLFYRAQDITQENAEMTPDTTSDSGHMDKVSGDGDGIVRYCGACGSTMVEGALFCPMCGTKVHSSQEEADYSINGVDSVEKDPSDLEIPDRNSYVKELSIEDQLLMQRIDQMEQEIGKQEPVTEAQPTKRSTQDWWKNWVCSNCGYINPIGYKRCLSCGLDIRSSYTLGRKNGSVSVEEEQFYYERVLPYQTQNEMFQGQNQQMMQNTGVRPMNRNPNGQIYNTGEHISAAAVISLIIGILSLYASLSLSLITQPMVLAAIALLAVLLSISPIVKRSRGYGMAIAGLICGLISFARVVMVWSVLTNGYDFLFSK